RLYAEAFRRAELDVEALPAEEATERIRESSVAVELAAMLDHWSRVRLTIRGQADASWKHLMLVARDAAPDGWRDRRREALKQENQQALVDLAGSEEVLRQPPLVLSHVAQYLQDRGAVEPAEALLRQAWQRHPGDFWANHDLAEALRKARPPRWGEAIGFYTAAVVLRPQSPGAHLNLGAVRLNKDRLDESITEFEKAVRFKKDYAEAHNELGSALEKKGRLDEAIREYREATQLKKDYAEAHNNLGIALGRKGLMDQAIAEFREAMRIKKD